MELTFEQKLDKLRKLLAKTKNNPSQEEAQSVLLLAQRLMVKWNIDMAEVSTVDSNNTPKEVEKVTVFNQKSYSSWKSWLANIIETNFRCMSLLTSYNRQHFITFLGLKEDAKIAAEVFEYAVSAIESGANRCYRQLKETARSTKGIKGDYIVGFLLGLEAKFKEQVKEYGWGLVLVRDKEVDEAYNKIKFSKPLNGRTLTVQNNSAARLMGYKDGQAFDVSEKNLKLIDSFEKA